MVTLLCARAVFLHGPRSRRLLVPQHAGTATTSFAGTAGQRSAARRHGKADLDVCRVFAVHAHQSTGPQLTALPAATPSAVCARTTTECCQRWTTAAMVRFSYAVRACSLNALEPSSDQMSPCEHTPRRQSRNHALQNMKRKRHSASPPQIPTGLQFTRALRRLCIAACTRERDGQKRRRRQRSPHLVCNSGQRFRTGLCSRRRRSALGGG